MLIYYILNFIIFSCYQIECQFPNGRKFFLKSSQHNKKMGIFCNIFAILIVSSSLLCSSCSILNVLPPAFRPPNSYLEVQAQLRPYLLNEAFHIWGLLTPVISFFLMAHSSLHYLALIYVWYYCFLIVSQILVSCPSL